MTAYGALLPQAALDIPPHGWVNLHFSVLPAWRGAAPVQHAVLRGDDITGATTFQIVKELDAGPVFGTLTEPVRPTDTSGDLLDRLAVVRRGAPGRDPGRDRGRHGPRRAAAGRRRQLRAEAHPGRRPRRLEAPRPPDRPPDPRLHPGPRRLDRVRRQPAVKLGRSSCWPVTAGGRRWPGVRRSQPRPRRAARRPQRRLRGHRLASRSASATSSRRASAACPPPTGPAACARTPATQPGLQPDMGNYRGPRRGAPGRRGATGRAGTRRGDQGRRQATQPQPAAGHGPPARPRPGAAPAPRQRHGRGRRATCRAAPPTTSSPPCDDREAYANLLLPRLLAERGITGRDAALATELTYGTLRGQGTYDAVLAACSDRPLDKLDPPVLRRAAARHPPAAQHPGRRPRRRRDLGRPGQVGGRPAGLRLRQRGAAPRRHPRPRRLAAASSPRTRRPTRTATWRSATATPAGSSPPTATPSAPAADTELEPLPWPRQRPPPRHAGRLPRRPAPRGDHARGRRARPLVPVRLHARRRRPRTPRGRRRRRRPGRGQPAGRDRAGRPSPLDGP